MKKFVIAILAVMCVVTCGAAMFGGAAYYGSWQHVTTFQTTPGCGKMVFCDGSHLLVVELEENTTGGGTYLVEKTRMDLPDLRPPAPEPPPPTPICN